MWCVLRCTCNGTTATMTASNLRSVRPGGKRGRMSGRLLGTMGYGHDITGWGSLPPAGTHSKAPTPGGVPVPCLAIPAELQRRGGLGAALEQGARQRQPAQAASTARASAGQGGALRGSTNPLTHPAHPGCLPPADDTHTHTTTTTTTTRGPPGRGVRRHACPRPRTAGVSPPTCWRSRRRRVVARTRTAERRPGGQQHGMASA